MYCKPGDATSQQTARLPPWRRLTECDPSDAQSASDELHIVGVGRRAASLDLPRLRDELPRARAALPAILSAQPSPDRLLSTSYPAYYNNSTPNPRISGDVLHLLPLRDLSPALTAAPAGPRQSACGGDGASPCAPRPRRASCLGTPLASDCSVSGPSGGGSFSCSSGPGTAGSAGAAASPSDASPTSVAPTPCKGASPSPIPGPQQHQQEQEQTQQPQPVPAALSAGNVPRRQQAPSPGRAGPRPAPPPCPSLPALPCTTAMAAAALHSPRLGPGCRAFGSLSAAVGAAGHAGLAVAGRSASHGECPPGGQGTEAGEPPRPRPAGGSRPVAGCAGPPPPQTPTLHAPPPCMQQHQHQQQMHPRQQPGAADGPGSIPTRAAAPVPPLRLPLLLAPGAAAAAADRPGLGAAAAAASARPWHVAGGGGPDAAAAAPPLSVPYRGVSRTFSGNEELPLPAAGVDRVGGVGCGRRLTEGAWLSVRPLNSFRMAAAGPQAVQAAGGGASAGAHEADGGGSGAVTPRLAAAAAAATVPFGAVVRGTAVR